MDLLVLADETGAVDMTLEAIARRTNVPINEVKNYIDQLCQPDSKSRSQVEEGKRLMPLDSNRDWGWQIVNYHHYRKLRDQETMRLYFRDAQRKYRAKRKESKEKQEVQEEEEGRGQNLLNDVKTVKKSSKTRQPSSVEEVINYALGLGIPKNDAEYFFDSQESGGWTRAGKPMRDWRAALRAWHRAGHLPSSKNVTQRQRQLFDKVNTERQSRLEREMQEARQTNEQTRTGS